MLRKSRIASMTLASAIVIVPSAHAVDSDVKCEFTKLKEAGKYVDCRLKAESKGVKRGVAADYTRCEDKFSLKWGKAETRGRPRDQLKGQAVCFGS